MAPQADELEKIAEAGRQLAAHQEAAGREPAANELTEQSREAERVRLRSVSGYARWGWMPAAIPFALVIILAGFTLIPASWFISGAETDPGTFAVLAFGFFPFLVCNLLRPTFGRRALRHEQDWLLGLPFQVSGYLACLTHSPRDGEARASISFEGPAPDVELLANVLRTIGAEVKPGDEKSGAAGVVAIRDFYFESSVSTNAHIRKWVHDLVERCVVLHATYPIAKIEINLSW